MNTLQRAKSMVRGAANAAVDLVGDGATMLATNFKDKVINPAQDITREIDRNGLAMFMSQSYAEYDGFDEVMKNDGADFGDVPPGAQPVLLRVEVVTSTECKIAALFGILLDLIVIGLIIVLAVLKVNVDYARVITQNTYFAVSVGFACFFASLILLFLVKFGIRMTKVKRRGLVWSKRRLVVSVSTLASIAIQFLNVVFLIATQGVVLYNPCNFRGKAAAVLGFMQITCWNTLFFILLMMSHNGTLWRRKKDKNALVFSQTSRITRNSLVMDAPIWIHKNLVILWILFELFFALALWSMWGGLGRDPSCASVTTNCYPSNATVAFMSTGLGITGLYAISYWYFSTRSTLDIESRPYSEMKFARIVFGLQHSRIFPVFVVMTVSLVVLTAIHLRGCWTYIQIWLGLAPLHAVATSAVLILGFYYMPKLPNTEVLLNSWLQEFSWAEANMADDLDRRNVKLAESKELKKQPMFCVETAIKLMYFANFVYSAGTLVQSSNDDDGLVERTEIGDIENNLHGDEYDCVESSLDGIQSRQENDGGEEDSDSILLGCGNLTDAMEIMHLSQFDVLKEDSTDTVGLICWNTKRADNNYNNTIVLAFKGTSSMQNVKTDVDFRKVVHEPERSIPVTAAWGLKQVTSRPRVHKGFYKAWRGADYHKRVLKKFGEILNSMHDKERVKVYITGHSLGGALATLCAIELKNTPEYSSLPIQVYTYGQPRVGNRAFAVDYDDRIPNHFCVIHDQDPVVRLPKGNYKKTGNRIIVNTKAEIIVRPTFLEVHLLNKAGVVKDHFLEGYRKSFMTIIKSQFLGAKNVERGRYGAACLATDLNLNKALMGIHMDLISLEDKTTKPMTEEEVERELTKHQKEAHVVEKKDAGFGPHMLLCGCRAHLAHSEDEGDQH